MHTVADPGGLGGLCLPPFLDFFLQKRSLPAKISTKRVRNLSQNAGNGYFRDSNLQNFLGGGGGGMPPHPLESSRLRRSLVPHPLENPGSAP